jgi:hypothetical protein
VEIVAPRLAKDVSAEGLLAGFHPNITVTDKCPLNSGTIYLPQDLKDSKS